MGRSWPGANECAPVPQRFCLAPYGSTLAVELDHPEALARVDSLLLPGWSWAGPTGQPLERLSLQFDSHFSIYADDELHMSGLDLETGMLELGKLLHLRLGATARGLAFVHAGVVGYQGKAMIIPGRSYTGKSSLVHALVEAGATYYSDEYAVFDPEGRVHPFPRHLALRQPPDQIAPHELGWSPNQRALEPGLILLTRYQEGVRLRLRPVPPGKAVLALVDNSLSARLSPEETLTILARVAASAPTLKGPRPEAEAVAARLLTRLKG